MRTRIHVNQHIIKSNIKNGETAPPISVKNYKVTRNTDCVEILDTLGQVVVRVIYDPEGIACGAKVWIETNNEVVCY